MFVRGDSSAEDILSYNLRRAEKAQPSATAICGRRPRIRAVTLHTGLVVDAVVRAIVEKTDGVRLQVDYGKDVTTLVELWRVHAK
jgi:hypothetical protein